MKNSKVAMIKYKGGSCIFCGYNKCPSALEFHHRDPQNKKFNLSQAKGIKFENAIPELEKCDLICARCHRELHSIDEYDLTKIDISKPIKKCTKCHQEKNITNFYKFSDSVDGYSWECKICNYQRKIDKKNKIKKLLIDKKDGCCELCGYNKSIQGLDFHHKNPKLKSFKISSIQKYDFDNIVMSPELEEEMNKCKLLCVNCHRELHYSDPTQIRTEI